MKTFKSNLATYLMILLMAGLVMGVMIQFAKAQSTAPSGNQNQAQVIQTNLPQRNNTNRLLENTTLNYYQMFLGPTASGSSSETYNVFQDGRAPLQSFHSANIRHQINLDWAVGVSLATTNTYTGEVKNKPTKESPMGVTNSPGDIWYNARAFVAIPALKTAPVNVFTTIAYEAPTSVISRNDDMKYGWVLSENFALNTGSYKWNAGVTAQAYRMVYKNNVKAPPFAVSEGGRPIPLQTMIVSGGPYVSYRFNDKWMMASSVILDWDQRGDQTNTTKFNNNLPDRARIGGTYFPSMKYVSSIGLFAQTLLQPRAESTMFGGEFALRF